MDEFKTFELEGTVFAVEILDSFCDRNYIDISILIETTAGIRQLKYQLAHKNLLEPLKARIMNKKVKLTARYYEGTEKNCYSEEPIQIVDN